MPKIDKITARIIDLPTIRGHVLSMTTMTVQSLVLVRIDFADGSHGIGEGASIGGLSYGAESCESIISAIVTYIAPAIIGLDGDNVNGARLAAERAVLGNPIARCTVENALWDGFGRRCDMPVSAFFGGALHSGLEVAWTLASGNVEQDIEEALMLLEQRRHRQFKLKIGKRAVRDDIAHVAKIREALGASARITVDVNQAWSLHDARIGLKGLQEIGVDMVEQPIAACHLSELAYLSRNYEIAVMADEALKGPEDALNHVRGPAADAFAVKIAQSGGLTRARDVISIGQAAGLGLYGGTMLESGVATAAALQLFCTVDHLAWGTELFGPLLFKDDILTEPLTYSDFQVHVPTGPGSGVNLDEEKVEFYQRGRIRPMQVKASV